MAELLVPVHAIVAAPALPRDRDVAGFFEITQDHVCSALGDPNGLGDVSDTRIGIPADLHEHMTMIREKRPLAIIRHDSIVTYFLQFDTRNEFHLWFRAVGSTSVAIQNLTSVPVLVFVLGLLAALVKSDIRLPEPVYQVISVYLLFGIGLKGGLSLQQSQLASMAGAIAATLVLGVVIPVLAFGLLRLVPAVGEVDRGAIAAHYGSTSLVTFSAALVFLETSNIEYEGFATALLTIMEIPGIVVGIFLATRHINRQVDWRHSLQEVLLGKTILLLVGGLVIGYLTGSAGYARISPFFVDLLPGILALFLLHLGFIAGDQLHHLRAAGPRLVVFALVFPILAGVLGILAGNAVGLSVGGMTVLGVLAASASYIAAPAALSIAVPEANKGLAITMSIGLTFPMNLVIGIPLYVKLAQLIG